MKRVVTIFFFIFLLFPAAHSRGGEEGETYAPLFVEACTLWKVPLPLALAIARQESGIQPWAVNVEGEGYVFETQDEALTLIDRSWSRGASFDAGLMQINSYWMRRYHLDPHLLLEPRKNVIMGVWIISKEIERFGLTWRAVASYHTPVDKNPERARNYALAVIRQIRKFRK
jgi:soluble lytic murein transglycosylase-like protein